MKLIRGVMELVDGGTRRRIWLSAGGSATLAVLDMVAVLLVFPLIQMLASPGQGGDNAVTSFIPIRNATYLAIAVVGLFALKNLLAIAFMRWNLRFIISAETNLATRLFANRLAVASTTPGSVDTAALQRTLGESLRRVFTEGLAFTLPAIADQLVIVLLATVVLLLAPLEAAVAVATFAVAALGYRRLIYRRTGQASVSLHADHRLAHSIARESLRASREIALLQAQPHFVHRYDDLRHRVGDAQRTIAMNEQLPRSFLELCLLLCTAAVAAVAFSHHTTATALALVATFAAVGFRVLPSLNRVLLASTRNRAAIPSLEQIRTDLADTPPSVHAAGAEVVAAPVRRVTIEGLTVQVPGRDAPLLSSVDLQLRPGEMVGILGVSGAGKTSLVNALLGFIPATAGRILVNDTVSVTGPGSWGGRAAVVPQDVVVLDASLRENVGFGHDANEIDDDRVRAALALAHLDDIVAELPDGLGTVLGESGARLSGGQRQRLGVARALFHDTDVLVLDESTAGLDSETEQRLLTTLLELRQDRVVLFVSHHRSVLEHCDRLVVLDAGRIVGAGSADELDDLVPGAPLGPRPLAGLRAAPG